MGHGRQIHSRYDTQKIFPEIRVPKNAQKKIDRFKIRSRLYIGKNGKNDNYQHYPLGDSKMSEQDERRELTDNEMDALEHAIMAARERESISINAFEYFDFSKMSDDKIEEWLLATKFEKWPGQEVDEKKAPGNLFADDADENIWSNFIKADDERKRQVAWHALVANMKKINGLDYYASGDDMRESKKHKKHKKYSSFKNQQTITESFRRFLKK